ncbi:MAG TPA: 2-phospho-L-lactate transferase [Candidatus Binataceae bacterium]|nr:2-phospho-L-lactate transferase [Candidatus Binataceae bacterium]
MPITTLAGGVGAAKFLAGLARVAGQPRLNVIVNTGDDEEFYGLHVSPDLDTVTYTLAGVSNRATGWGLAGETFNVLPALSRFFGKPWFNLGDRDLATHIFRTERLRAGDPLSRIAAEIARRLGVRARLMPMTDERVRTFVKLRGRDPMPFQEYFVRRRARGIVERIELRGVSRARPLAAALDAVRQSSAVIIAPSNPFVSIGPILALRPMRAAIRRERPRVAAISPIIGRKAVKGPADRMLRGLGHEPSALGVARLYRDICATFVIDEADRALAPAIERLGMHPVVTDIIMADETRAARLAEVVLRAAGE